MEPYLQGIVEQILAVVKKENSELLNFAENEINSELGIFHMPELAFAYQCGKQVMLHAEKIFGENIPKWGREIGLGNGGLTDLVFIFNDGKKIAIEFKMRTTGEAYIRDIDKLSKIKDVNITRILVAVIDAFAKEPLSDGRVMEIDNDDRSVKLGPIKVLETKQSWYKREVSAVVGIWKIKPA